MIIVVAFDQFVGAALFGTLANAPGATFGERRRLGLYNPPLASNENLYLVAGRAAYNSSRAPVIGDDVSALSAGTLGGRGGTTKTGSTSGSTWTVQLLMAQLEDIFPSPYSGSVFLAVGNVEEHGACRDFAGMFKTLLMGERQMTGDVNFHPGQTVGPIFPAGDPRWSRVRAIPVLASPIPITKLPTLGPMMPS